MIETIKEIISKIDKRIFVTFSLIIAGFIFLTIGCRTSDAIAASVAVPGIITALFGVFLLVVSDFCLVRYLAEWWSHYERNN